MKIIGNAVATIALLLFLILIGEDSLHWYSIPLSNNLHQTLFIVMVCLSGANCLLLLYNLTRISQSWARLTLKFVLAPAEMETKAETLVLYTNLSVVAALCFYTAAVIWGVIDLSRGPFVKAGDLALSVFIAYNATATVVGVKLERLKRSIKSRRAKV